MILLAEDEEHIAKLILFKLKKEGHEIQHAKNGVEAVDLFKTQPHWKLIILDIMMPLKDGWQTLQEIRQSQNAEGKAISPVLILSAKSSTVDTSHLMGVGQIEYLKKPFDPSELATLVKKMTQK